MFAKNLGGGRAMGVKTKLKSSSPRVLNAWLLFGTLLAVVTMFLFYSFVFVKNNQVEQDERRIRVLRQVGENIVQRENSFRRISQDIIDEIQGEIKVKSGFWGKVISFLQFSKEKTQLEEKMKRTTPILKLAKKKWLRGKRCYVFAESKGAYTVYADTTDFLGPLRRPGVLDELIYLKEELVKEELEESESPGTQEPQKMRVALYHSIPGDVHISKEKVLEAHKGAREGWSIQNIRISGKSYKLFFLALEPYEDGRMRYAGGLMEARILSSEARRLRPGIILLLVIGAILFILAIPLAKLFFMSTFDQLNINDVVLTSLSISFGIVPLVLLFLFTHQVTSDTAATRQSLVDLAAAIDQDFSGELKLAYRQLKHYDSSEPVKNHVLSRGNYYKDILYPRATVIGAESSTPAGEDALENEIKPEIYDRFKVAFWMDANGKQKLQFFTRNYDGSFDNLEHRRYFREAGKWRLPDGDAGDRFMLESIISTTSGEAMAAISKRSSLNLKEPGETYPDRTEMEVAAMTTQLTSLIDTILPVGYGFCVIDKNGDVWFHSNQERNLSENFANEVKNDKDLLNAIERGHPKHLQLDYQNMDCMCYIQPFAGLPLSIVTFHDIAYADSVRDYVVMDTASFMLILLVVNGLFLFFASLREYKPSRLLHKNVPFQWLRPMKIKKEYYQYLVFSNMVILLFTIVFKYFTRGHGTLLLCAAACFMSFGYSFKIVTGKWDGGHLLVSKRLLASIRKSKPFGKIQVEQSYIFFLISWLVLVCMAPAIMFYVDNYFHEKLLSTRYLQFKLAEDIRSRNDRIDTLYTNKVRKKGDEDVILSSKANRENEGIYSEIVGNTQTAPVDAAALFEKAGKLSVFDSITYHTRIALDPIAADKKDLVLSPPEDFKWRKKGSRLFLQYPANAGDTGGGGDMNYIDSTVAPFKMSWGLILLTGTVSVLLVLVLVYFLVRKAARKIFGLNLSDAENGEWDYNQIRQDIRDQVAAGSNIVIYCQTGNEMECTGAMFRDSSQERDSGDDDRTPVSQVDFSGDFNEDLKKLQVGKETGGLTILVENFRVFPGAGDDPSEKIERLLQLTQIPGLQVIIPALAHPQKMLENYGDQQMELENEEKRLLHQKMTSQSLLDKARAQLQKVNRMTALLTEMDNVFVTLCAPLKTFDKDKTPDEDRYPHVMQIKDKTIKTLILEEFNDIRYFADIDERVYNYFTRQKVGGITVTEDDMILKIQELAHHYYYKLLDSCTIQEKLILYDIARDMLVNSDNMAVIKILLKKNLLVYSGIFRLMNRSFRNFILASITPGQLEEYLKVLQPHNKWGSYKFPLSLIALGILLFLGFQGNLLNNAAAIVTTAGTGFALLTKISGIWRKLSGGGVS